MQTYSFNRIVVLVAAGMTLFTSAATAAGRIVTEAPAGGRLIVWRSPGLGNDLVVGLIIDGRRAADLTYGAHFDTILPPGRHSIGVKAFPQPFPRGPAVVVIDVRPGQLYNFTAKGGTNQLILKRS